MTDDGAVLLGQAAAEWRERFESRCNFSSDYHGEGMRFEFPPVFAPATWRTLPIPGGVDDDGILFSAEPDEVDLEDVALARFRRVSEAYLQAHWPPLSPFAEFWPMVRESGVEEIAVTGWGAPIDGVWVGPPSEEAVRDATMRHFDELGMTAVECALTDASGRWAIYSSSLEEISVLGGEPAFIDAFVARAGGLPWLQAIHAIKHQSEQLGRESFRTLYTHVGWTWPFDQEGRPSPPPASKS